MAVYYLIVGNKIKQEIDTDDEGNIALPLMGGANACSLLNRAHIISLMNRGGLTASQVIDYMGLVDERPEK